jgi:hypothetical protein
MPWSGRRSSVSAKSSICKRSFADVTGNRVPRNEQQRVEQYPAFGRQYCRLCLARVGEWPCPVMHGQTACNELEQLAELGRVEWHDEIALSVPLHAISKLPLQAAVPGEAPFNEG